MRPRHIIYFVPIPIILVLLFATRVNAQPFPPPSPMQREWLEHLFRPWDPDPPVPFLLAPRSPGLRPSVTVFGYLPYWNVGKPSLVLHLDRLHVLAYFAASLNSDGSLGDLRHWGTSTIANLIELAHDAGVRVVLCVTNFNSSSISAFLSSSSARAAAISNLVTAVASAGGNGVNVDFEGVPKANKSDLVTFIRELKQSLDAALGDSHVSLATPAVDWSGAFDYDLLAEASDGLFIMGYDYHWRGGPPGPVSPLTPSVTWGKYSLAWTVDDYIQWGGDHNRSRFILGLPLYGYDWPTTGPDIPGTATAKAEARFYARCQEEAAQYGSQWDPESSTPYYMYQDNGWHQVWCENRQSLSLKYSLVADRHLGGIGFWALGYEQDYIEVWDELTLWFPPVAPPDSAPDEVTPDGFPDLSEEPDVADEPVPEISDLTATDLPEPQSDLVLEPNPSDPRPNLPDSAQSHPDPTPPSPVAHCSSGCRASRSAHRAFPLAILLVILLYRQRSRIRA